MGHMLLLWRMWQGGDFGVGHLPEAGGAADQPVIMINAFMVMNAMEAALRGDRDAD